MPPNSETSLSLGDVTDIAEVDVVLPAHLHARPAAELARAAAGFPGCVEIAYQGKTVRPTGILAVMGLGATAGTTVTLRARGEDAQGAINALATLLRGIE